MKLSTIVSVVVGSLMLLLVSLYQVATAIDDMSSLHSGARKIALFSVIAFFSISVLVGVYKNRKWSLYVFLSMTIFMVGSFISIRLATESTLVTIDYIIILSGMVVSGPVLYVLSKMKTLNLFSENEFYE